MKKAFAVLVCVLLFSSQLYAQNPPCPSRTIEIIDMGGWGTSYTYCDKVFLEVDSELLGVIRSVNDPLIQEYLNGGRGKGCFGAVILVGGALALGWGLAMLQGSDTETLEGEDTPAYLNSDNSLPLIMGGGAVLLLGLMIYESANVNYRKAIERYNEIIGNRLKVSYRNDALSKEQVWNVGYTGMAF